MKRARESEREFSQMLDNFENKIGYYKGAVEINKEITLLSVKLTSVENTLYEYLKLLTDPDELYQVEQMHKTLTSNFSRRSSSSSASTLRK